MNHCEICDKAIKQHPERRFHPSCLKRMFNTGYFPAIEFSGADPGRRRFKKIAGRITVSCIQPRVPLSLNRKKKQLEPARGRGDFLLKPQVQGLGSISANEHTCMTIAAHLGIPVAPHCLVRLADNSTAFMVRRPGRFNGKAATYETFLTLLNKSDTYDGDLEEIGQTIRRMSDIPGLDVQLFFERVMLSYILGNTNMDLEDFAMYRDSAGEIRLSPACDILSTQLALPEKIDFTLPMMGKTSGVRGHDFVAFSRRLGIPPKAYDKILLTFFKGKRAMGRVIKNSGMTMEEKLKLSDIINRRLKRLLR